MNVLTNYTRVDEPETRTAKRIAGGCSVMLWAAGNAGRTKGQPNGSFAKSCFMLVVRHSETLCVV